MNKTRQKVVIVHLLLQVMLGQGWLRQLSASRQRFALTAQRRIFQAGDKVFLPDQKEGVVKENRGSGWFTVQLPGEEIQKFRATQLTPLIPESSPDKTVVDIASLPLVQVPGQVKSKTPGKPKMPLPAPTILNLDQAVRALTDTSDTVLNPDDRVYLTQVAHHLTFQKWVVFTDLHCSPSTMSATMATLDFVHQCAVDRGAGILFLGDWWHHRGSLRVDCLNAVLEKLSSWQVPMVMIPGNHDQVTLGGHVHSLTPMENAYRIQTDKDGKTCFGPLVLTYPTLFGNALFVPHIRDNAVMESVLQSNLADQADALFVHADVTGAYMNDLIRSLGGVPPHYFPKDKPIYSGHFHKPHVIEQGGVSIEYLGSPYEVSLAEAQQNKSLAVLDSSQGWSCTEKIPISVGRKHFRPVDLDTFLELRVGDNVDNMPVAGDRVVLSIDKDALAEMRRSAEDGEMSTLDCHVDALRGAGVVVEIRETKQLPTGPMVGLELPKGINEGTDISDMTMESTWKAYLDGEVQRKSIPESRLEFLHDSGLEFLRQLEPEESESSYVGNSTKLELESLTVQGFGPFLQEQTYPFGDRGLVLLRGRNTDGGPESNGSGKSSLVMSALWALTGTIDPRPLEDSKVSDVLNDSAKVARVSLSGKLNGVDFTLSRSKTRTKGNLVFMLGDRDLTAQSATETQARIEEEFGVSSTILARTIFHGQHNLNNMLEATDSKLKEELSTVVPMDRWKNAVVASRKKARESKKLSSELIGKISIRTADVGEFEQQLEELQEVVMKEESLLRKIANEISQLDATLGAHDPVDKLQKAQNGLEEAGKLVKEAEAALSLALSESEQELSSLRQTIQELSLTEAETISRCRYLQNQVGNLEKEQARRKAVLSALEAQWSVEFTDEVSFQIALPDNCPTCLQPLGEGHDHIHLEESVQSNVLDALTAAQDVSAELERTRRELADSEGERDLLSHKRAQLAEDLKIKESLYASTTGKQRRSLDDAKQKHADAVSALSDCALSAQRKTTQEALEMKAKNQSSKVQLAKDLKHAKNKQVNDAVTLLGDLKADLEQQKKTTALMTELSDLFGQYGVQNFVLQSAIQVLEATTQQFLDEISDGSQKLHFTLDSGDRISRRVSVLDNTGCFRERPLASLSGGQWRRCSIAFSFGFADLLARRGSFRSNLVVLDEPLTHLDRSGRTAFGRLCRKLTALDKGGSVSCLAPATIVIILQDLAAEELEEAFDYTDEVIRRSGSSSVVVDQ